MPINISVIKPILIGSLIGLAIWGIFDYGARKEREGERKVYQLWDESKHNAQIAKEKQELVLIKNNERITEHVEKQKQTHVAAADQLRSNTLRLRNAIARNSRDKKTTAVGMADVPGAGDACAGISAVAGEMATAAGESAIESDRLAIKVNGLQDYIADVCSPTQQTATQEFREQ